MCAARFLPIQLYSSRSTSMAVQSTYNVVVLLDRAMYVYVETDTDL